MAKSTTSNTTGATTTSNTTSNTTANTTAATTTATTTNTTSNWSRWLPFRRYRPSFNIDYITDINTTIQQITNKQTKTTSSKSEEDVNKGLSMLSVVNRHATYRTCSLQDCNLQDAAIYTTYTTAAIYTTYRMAATYRTCNATTATFRTTNLQDKVLKESIKLDTTPIDKVIDHKNKLPEDKKQTELTQPIQLEKEISIDDSKRKKLEGLILLKN